MEINSDDFTLVDFLDADDSDIFAKTRPFYRYIEDLKGKRAYSYHRPLLSACGNRAVVLDSHTGLAREMVMMSSNNYLGLSVRPELGRAAVAAVAKYGAGMCGSRFLSGTYDLVEELERRLADFEHVEEVMVFTTGYQANVGTISALMRAPDLALIDRLCHASIVDGCRMAGCAYRTFRHNDVDHLAYVLEKCAAKHRGKLVIVDGVFSMDGDVAPLPEIVEVARRYGARVMVDEAHATGVLGDDASGTVDHFNLEGKIDITLGTFSKTFASTGGYIGASKEVVNYVRHYGRSYMFSASPVPAAVASVMAALDIVRKEPELRERLWENIRYMHQGIKNLGFEVFPDPPESAILTIPIGADATVHAMSRDIYEGGVLMSNVVYPAVGRNKGKIRLSLSAAHTREDMDRVLEVLQVVGLKYGIIGQVRHEDPVDSACAAR
jgi:glycine C-acetyltransferase